MDQDIIPNKDLLEKLQAIAWDCRHIAKDALNPIKKYPHLSSDALLAALNPALNTNRVVMTCKTEILDMQAREAAGGAIWTLATVKVIIRFIDADTGANLETEGLGQGFSKSDKAISKAQTQARKYALMMAFSINTGDDPEADGEADKAMIPAIPCRKCGKPAGYHKEVMDLVRESTVQVYCCRGCRTETRVLGSIKDAEVGRLRYTPAADKGGGN